MNRVPTQNEDLRKMQQEAMRRVQEMQNKSQSYVRNNPEHYNNGYSTQELCEQETVNNENIGLDKGREKQHTTRTTQRTKASSKASTVPPVQIPRETDDCNNIPDSTPPFCSYEPSQESPLQDSCDCSNNANCKCDLQKPCSGSNNDLIIILIVLLLVNNKKSNPALILALVSLFI